MIHDRDAAGQSHIVAQDDAAADAGLAGDETIFPDDDVVRDLNLIVNFGAAADDR